MPWSIGQANVAVVSLASIDINFIKKCTLSVSE